MGSRSCGRHADMSAQRRKRGPKPKGNRALFSVMVPVDHLEYCREAAAQLGIPTGDYIVLKLAEAHGWPEPDYISRNKAQEALPISA